MPAASYWTPSQDAELRAYWQSKIGITAIARAMGKTTSAITHRRRRLDLVSPHSPAARRMKADTRINQFTALLADGASIPEIRAKMGLTNGQAQGMMHRIRADLGWQAI